MTSALTVAQLMVRVGGDASGAEKALGSVGVMMSKTGPIALGGVIIGAAIAAVGAISLKMAADFQTGLETLVTGAGEAQSNIGMINKALLQMAVATGTSTGDLINGLFMIESAGYRGAQGLNVLQVAAEGAKVGNADLGDVANALTTILTDYHLSASQAAEAMNILTGTVANGKVHLQDLSTSLSTILPAAAAMKIPLNDIMAAMAAMTAQSGDAATSATYLRQMILMLEAPSAQATKALNSIGLTTDEVAAEMRVNMPDALNMILQHANETFGNGTPKWVAAMKDLVGGTRSMQGILMLTSKTGLADFRSALEKITESVKKGGDSVTGWTTIQKTFNLQLSRAAEAAQVLMIQLGEHLLPVATQLMTTIASGLIPTVQNFIKFITGTSQQAEHLRPIIIAVAIAIGGAFVASVVAWTIAAGAAAVATIAATWPILAIGAAIALLVAGIIYAYNNWGWFRTAVLAVKSALGDFLGFIGAQVIPTLGNLAGYIGSHVGAEFKTFGEGVSSIIHLFEDLIGIAERVIGVFEKVSEAVRNAIGAAASAAGGILSHIPGFATGGTMPVTGLAVVGEQGPELVRLPGGTQITPLGGSNVIKGPPNNAYGAVTGGANANNGAPMVINLKLDGKQIAQVVTKYQPAIIRNATGTRSF